MNYPVLTELTISSEQVWKGNLLDVRRDQVTLPNQSISTREYIVHQGAVVIIPVLPNGKILFEQQHRYPLHQDFFELPAGKIDPGEVILATAQRELLEETGYKAETWRHLGPMHPCIGYSNEVIEIFLANDLTFSGQSLDQHEFLNVLELGLDEAIEWVKSGQITDGKTITALFWAEKVLNFGW